MVQYKKNVYVASNSLNLQLNSLMLILRTNLAIRIALKLKINKQNKLKTNVHPK